MGLLQATAEPARELLEVEKIDVVADKGCFRTEDIATCEKAVIWNWIANRNSWRLCGLSVLSEPR
jgi:hypothetical protein